MENIVEPIIYVNGKRHVLPPHRAEVALLSYLRELGHTGAKLGCGEGGCGACTVMVSSHEPDGSLHHRSINACLCPLYAVEGMHVVTVEGIGNARDGLHPVQERLANAHGSQCGFCTPGFVMSMYALLRSSRHGTPTEEEIEENLAGNLCRCTGYRPILDAFKPFAKADPSAYTEEAIAASRLNCASGNGALHEPYAAGHQSCGGGCEVPRSRTICPSTGKPCGCGEPADSDGVVLSSSAHKKDGTVGPLAPLRPSVEPIFPPELRKRAPAELALAGPVATWHRPLTLDRLLQLKQQHPEAKLVVGNSEVGIEMKFKAAQYPVFIGSTHVPELTAVDVGEDGVHLGASVTLTRILEACRELAARLPRRQTSALRAVAEQLRWFAGPPIRNGASLGGNICTASPISDLNPLWIAAGAIFTVAGAGAPARTVPAASFFLGYRKVDLAPHEVLVSVFVPFTRQFEYVKEFKQAHRRDDDIAIVNAGMRFRLQRREDSNGSGGWEIGEACISYGGVAALTISAPKTAAALAGKPLEASTVQAALEALPGDVRIDANAPGGMVEYRRSLAASFLFKGLLYAATQLEDDSLSSDLPFSPPFPESYKSAVAPYRRDPSHGLQYTSAVPDEDVVGQPYRHQSADMQVTGEAQYVDDMRLPPGALHAVLVLSTRPHAQLLSVDRAPAMAVPGVVGVYLAGDVPGGNDLGPVIHDEELFATGAVTCVGQPIGVVAAETEAAARAGARAVLVQYEDLPAVLDIDAAIAADSYYEGWGHAVERGDVEGSLAGGCDVVLEGEVRMGGQEHFYLEPNAHAVLPQENDEFLAYSSTQCLDKHQRYISHVLGIPMHKVVVKCKRLGGGFGGKETRAAFVNAAAAIPAFHLRHPVRLTLDRDEDMAITGQRHPFMARYRVGVSSAGRILAFDAKLYCNAGNSLDLSHSIMDRALISADCCYNTPHFRARGFVCRTNLPSNTAFRGFGGPQGMMAAEHMIDLVARHLGKPPEAIKALNMYNEGDTTPYGQVLDGCQARPCWDIAVAAGGGLEARRQAAAEFNGVHRFRKRGVAVTPTKFGISFTTKFLNQAGALIHVYQADGTVLVTHGGVEMGQGLHTKVAQVVAQGLGVPLSAVFVSETSTDKVPNASPSAASASSDMYGAAAANACSQLNARLAPFRERMPGASFKEVAQAAYLERVDLSAHGFYATPEISGFGGSRPFNYLCYGAAASEVELDTLTGDWQVLRSDVVMDVGRSLNPAIDVGQVEGAFVQGMGWSCIEELVWGDAAHSWVRPGTLFTRGPGSYKIPTANDIPVDFRVTLLRDAPCERTPQVHSSKAVGEPPFFLGTSVFWALKEAVYAARDDAGVKGWFQLDAPCTPERLRMACVDELTAPYAPTDLRPKLSC